MPDTAKKFDSKQAMSDLRVLFAMIGIKTYIYQLCAVHPRNWGNPEIRHGEMD